MTFKTQSAVEIKEVRKDHVTSIPTEVKQGMSREAAERLQRFVDSSERFQRRVYGEEPESRR